VTGRFVDLHLHTTHSDGRWTPREVVQQAVARGLAAIAITDHDVLTGLPEAHQAAAELGIELIDGVELTADWDGRTCHILGYGIDPAEPHLNDALAAGQASMAAHVDELLAAIRASGHELTAEELARYNTRYATGTAVVLGMVEKGILRGAANARELLALASREPRAYTAAKAIELIHGAGGLAVLAHPARLRRRESMLPAATFAPLVSLGLDGLEVWHVLQPTPVREHYTRAAGTLELLVVGGSDCHGPRSSGVRIGSQRVPDTVLRSLRSRLDGCRNTAAEP
jgi:3',5'-nucleoside bisphosphate phosphatase